MSDEIESSRRTIKVCAKSALEATYKVAVQYTLVHFLPPVAAEGEVTYVVTITAERKSS